MVAGAEAVNGVAIGWLEADSWGGDSGAASMFLGD